MRSRFDAGSQSAGRISQERLHPRRQGQEPGQGVGLADGRVRLRRLVRRANGQATRQEGRRRRCSPSGRRTTGTCSITQGRIRARQAARRLVADAVRSDASTLGPTITEGTSWNYTFFVPQDVPDLITPDRRRREVHRQARPDVRRDRAAGRHPRPDRPDRPVRSRQRALPPHRLSLQLRRRAVEDAGRASARS